MPVRGGSWGAGGVTTRSELLPTGHGQDKCSTKQRPRELAPEPCPEPDEGLPHPGTPGVPDMRRKPTLQLSTSALRAAAAAAATAAADPADEPPAESNSLFGQLAAYGSDSDSDEVEEPASRPGPGPLASQTEDVHGLEVGAPAASAAVPDPAADPATDVQEFLKEIEALDTSDPETSAAVPPVKPTAASAAAPNKGTADPEMSEFFKEIKALDAVMSPSALQGEAVAAGNDGGDSSLAADKSAAAEPAESDASLPDGWMECLDTASGDIYFWHTESGRTSWERPRPEAPETDQAVQPTHTLAAADQSVAAAAHAGPEDAPGGGAGGIGAEGDNPMTLDVDGQEGDAVEHMSRSVGSHISDLQDALEGYENQHNCGLGYLPAERSSDSYGFDGARLRRVKAIEGIGLDELWKPLNSSALLTRLQFGCSLSLMDWCRGKLSGPEVLATLRDIGQQVAAIDTVTTCPSGWECQFSSSMEGDGANVSAAHQGGFFLYHDMITTENQHERPDGWQAAADHDGPTDMQDPAGGAENSEAEECRSVTGQQEESAPFWKVPATATCKEPDVTTAAAVSAPRPSPLSTEPVVQAPSEPSPPSDLPPPMPPLPDGGLVYGLDRGDGLSSAPEPPPHPPPEPPPEPPRSELVTEVDQTWPGPESIAVDPHVRPSGVLSRKKEGQGEGGQPRKVALPSGRGTKRARKTDRAAAVATDRAAAVATTSSNQCTTKATKSSKIRFTKKMQPLVDKWATARAQLDEGGAEGGEDYDGQKQARRKLQQTEDWRVKTIATGEASGNSNFQPLPFDWRARVTRLRKEGEDPVGLPSAPQKHDKVVAKQTVTSDPKTS